MTATASETLVSQDADLVAQITELLAAHPAGESFQLLLTPRELTVEQDEVLVQEVDPGGRSARIEPRKISRVTATDVLHDTQLRDLSDKQHVQRMQPTTSNEYCHAISHPNGSRGHVYFD